MALPKIEAEQQKTSEGKKLKISVSVSKYLKERMDELVRQGHFASISEIMSLATMKFLTEFEAQSKKPPESAEERIKTATHAGSKDVEVD